MHACQPSTWEAGPCGVSREILSQTKAKNDISSSKNVYFLHFVTSFLRFFELAVPGEDSVFCEPRDDIMYILVWGCTGHEGVDAVSKCLPLEDAGT